MVGEKGLVEVVEPNVAVVGEPNVPKEVMTGGRVGVAWFGVVKVGVEKRADGLKLKALESCGCCC